MLDCGVRPPLTRRRSNRFFHRFYATNSGVAAKRTLEACDPRKGPGAVKRMNSDEITKAFTLANEFKEGDLPLGGTRDDKVRAEARLEISHMTAAQITRTDFVEDGISEALRASLDRAVFDNVAGLTVNGIKQRLLSPDGPAWAAEHRAGLSSEVIAAVAKVMTGDELSHVCCSLFNAMPGEGLTIGAPGHFGSRIQPNSPGDDEQEILMSVLEGLSFGCGDVIIGLNPASDHLDSIIALEDLLRRIVEGLGLPTRYCVLSDMVKQSAARSRVNVDVGFQSLAGTSRALVGMVGLDVDGLLDLSREFTGLYFETGQGSAVTNGVAEGVDMVTLESRAYGLARYLQRRTGAWTIVNDVAGFIGPEVFRTAAQLKRACLEDAMMAKLHGLAMGLDVCSTFHMGLDPECLRDLTTEIVASASPAYLMAVAGNSDPMLGYMTTAFRDHPKLRGLTRRGITSAMERRLAALGVSGERPGKLSTTSSLYSAYMKSLGDQRSEDALAAESRRKIQTMQERGFDIGIGDSSEGRDPGRANARIDAIYANARIALYARLDEGMITRISPRPLRVRSTSIDREDYLAHPSSGEHIRPEDVSKVREYYGQLRPSVQIVISDGLNANALNENLGRVLPGVRQGLAGVRIGDADVVIFNGRVRAGYEIGELTGAECVVHFIGERPGTGINTLSVYITYGLDSAGRSRWTSDLDHSATTAICGINRLGKAPEVAIDEIVRCVSRVLKSKCSGTQLHK
ncbi:MAG TPA: ethanolamine ammonia-lyase subunit EutB [Blastocatellia bacterium]|nr:ethanolamine ammonia-lyase subunit EutB [Blastocatellia bacterium]